MGWTDRIPSLFSRQEAKDRAPSTTAVEAEIMGGDSPSSSPSQWWNGSGSSNDAATESPSFRRFFSHLRDHYVEIPPETKHQWKQFRNGWTDEQTICLGLVGTTCFALGFQVNRLLQRRQWLWRRFVRVSDIPSQHFGPTAPYLRGRVVSVSDGDTVRFRHAPTWFHRSTLLAADKTNKNNDNNKPEKLSEITLPLRICTIDTPETPKFGKPGQPYGIEAKEHLTRLVQDRIVECQLLQTDQYGRAVAQVRTRRFLFWKRYVDELMLQAGWAEVYTGSGAVYGRLGGQEAYRSLMERAQSKRLGMWKNGSDEPRESAAEYKARMKSTDSE